MNGRIRTGRSSSGRNLSIKDVYYRVNFNTANPQLIILFLCRKQSTCSNCGSHGHSKRNCPQTTSNNVPATQIQPQSLPKKIPRQTGADEIADEHANKAPLHDDPDESDGK